MADENLPFGTEPVGEESSVEELPFGLDPVGEEAPPAKFGEVLPLGLDNPKTLGAQAAEWMMGTPDPFQKALVNDPKIQKYKQENLAKDVFGDPEADDAEFSKAIEEAKPYSQVKDQLGNVGKMFGGMALDLFSAPQAIMYGPWARFASMAADERGASEGILNPNYIQAMRERNGLPRDFHEAWDVVSKQGKMAQVSFLLQEGFPLSAEPADLGSIDRAVNDTVKNIEDPDMKNITRALLRFSWNVGIDPATYLTLGGLPAVKNSVREVEVAKSAKQNIEIAVEALKSSLGKNPKTVEQIAKERGLLRFRLPFSGKEIPLASGEKLAKRIDQMATYLEAKTPIRTLSQGAGFETFGSMERMREMNLALGHGQANKYEQFVKSVPGTRDYNVVSYASNLAEHGAKWGPEAYKAQKLPALSESEIREAQGISKFYQRNQVDARKFVKEVTGLEINTIGRPDVADRLTSPLINTSDFKLKLGDETYNYAYSTAYGFGRRASEEAVAAEEAAKEFARSTQNAGLNLKPSAMMHRDVQLSNAAADELMRVKKGIKGPYYDPNSTQVAFEKVSDLYQFAADYSFVKGVKDTYGVARNDIPAYIEGAKARVAQAVKDGASPMREDLVISKMSPSDFRPINSNAFDTMKYVSGQDIGMLIPKDLYYPKQVADRVNAMFGRPSQNGAVQALNWLNGLKARNIITNAFRLPKQAMDNFARARQANMPFGSIAKEMGIAVGESFGKIKPDHISEEMKLIPSISETVFNLGDFKGPTRINRQILANDEVLNMPQSYAEMVHATAKEGKLKSVFGTAKKIAEYPVDNPFSQFVRSVGNSADVLSKRAAYRYMRKQGYNPAEAADFVADTFMDFTKSTGTQKAMRWINPFIGFQLKNFETAINLALHSPGSVQLYNPSRGYLKRAFEDAGGWDPAVARKIQKEIPLVRDGALSFILRGNEDLESDTSEVRKLANRYYMGGLPEQDRQAFEDRGGVLNVKMFNPIQAAGDFLDPSRANENAYSPIVTSAIMYTAGYDPFKRKYIESQGSGYEDSDKLAMALQNLNPYDYKNFYNVMGKSMDVAKKFVFEAFSNPLDQETRDLIEAVGDENFSKELKRNKELGAFMSQAKFLGLGRMTPMRDTFFFHQMALLRMAKKNEALATGAMKDGKKDEAKKYFMRRQTIINNIDQNSKIFEDMENTMEAAGVKEEVPVFEEAPPEDNTGNIQAPANPGLPFGTDPVGREPQSEGGMKDNGFREPQGAADDARRFYDPSAKSVEIEPKEFWDKKEKILGYFKSRIQEAQEALDSGDRKKAADIFNELDGQMKEQKGQSQKIQEALVKDFYDKATPGEIDDSTPQLHKSLFQMRKPIDAPDLKENYGPPMPEREQINSAKREPAAEKSPGMISEGNIDMSHRPQVKNEDGSTSTVLSMSFYMDGKEILVPKVEDLGHGKGRIMSDREAIERYLKTGENLGTFKDAKSATEFAKKLHLKEEEKLK